MWPGANASRGLSGEDLEELPAAPASSGQNVQPCFLLCRVANRSYAGASLSGAALDSPLAHVMLISSTRPLYSIPNRRRQTSAALPSEKTRVMHVSDRPATPTLFKRSVLAWRAAFLAEK